jgi:hypothetical protein
VQFIDGKGLTRHGSRWHSRLSPLAASRQRFDNAPHLSVRNVDTAAQSTPPSSPSENDRANNTEQKKDQQLRLEGGARPICHFIPSPWSEDIITNLEMLHQARTFCL